MGVMKATDQVTIVEVEGGDTTELKTKVEELNNNLTASNSTVFRFGVNENGEYGYVVTDSEGADSVVPFSGKLKTDLLWENTNPTREFNAQTIGIDLSEYDSVFIDYDCHVLNQEQYPINTKVFVKNGEKGCLGAVQTTYGYFYGARLVTVSNDNIIFGDFYYVGIHTGENAKTNYMGVPQRIYGVKKEIVFE